MQLEVFTHSEIGVWEIHRMSKGKAKVEAFSARFNELLSEKGWDSLPDIELSKKLKKSNTTVWNWRNGIKLPSLDTAIELAVIFEVKVDWLLTGRGEQWVNAQLSEPDHDDVLLLSRLSEADKGHLKALFYSLADAQDQKERIQSGRGSGHGQ